MTLEFLIIDAAFVSRTSENSVKPKSNFGELTSYEVAQIA